MKKNCLGCKKDKPNSDFGTTGNARALCKSCRSARVGTTSRGKSSGDSVGGIIDGVIDFVTDLLLP